MSDCGSSCGGGCILRRAHNALLLGSLADVSPLFPVVALFFFFVVVVVLLCLCSFCIGDLPVLLVGGGVGDGDTSSVLA